MGESRLPTRRAQKGLGTTQMACRSGSPRHAIVGTDLLACNALAGDWQSGCMSHLGVFKLNEAGQPWILISEIHWSPGVNKSFLDDFNVCSG